MQVSLLQNVERNVTKLAPHEAPHLIAWGTLIFYERVVLNRVEGLGLRPSARTPMSTCEILRIST